jgi:hypothetical protein
MPIKLQENLLYGKRIFYSRRTDSEMGWRDNANRRFSLLAHSFNNVLIIYRIVVKYCLLNKHNSFQFKTPLHTLIGWQTCFAFWKSRNKFHSECEQFWIWQGHCIATFIIMSLSLISWQFQFITISRTQSALISKLCLKWLQISTWCVKCLQQWTYTEQNV